MSDIYLSLTETPTVVTLSQPVVSGALAGSVTVTNVVSVNVVTMPAINVSAPSVTTVAGSVAVSNFPASQVVSVSNFPSSSSVTIANFPATQVVSVSNFPASSSVTIGGFSTSSLPPSTVTVSSLPAISGTVTANFLAQDQWGTNPPESGNFLRSAIYYENSLGGAGEFTRVNSDLDGGLPIRTMAGQILEVAGTVTANTVLAPTQPIYESSESNADRCILIGTASYDGGQVFHTSPDNPLPISGTVTASVINSVTIGSLPAIAGTVTVTGLGFDSDGNLLVTLQPGPTPYTQPISGTVTANVPILSPENNPNSIVNDAGGARLTYGLQIGYDSTVNDSFTLVGDTNPLPISGTVTANVSGDWGVVVTSGIVGGTSNSGVIDLTGYPQNSLIEATLQISGGSAVRKFQRIDSQGQYPGADITLTKTFDGSTVVNFDPANSPSGVYVFRNPGGYVRFAYVSAGQGINTQSYKIRAVRDPYYGLNRPISGTVTIGNSVTISSLPAISGTVTANGGNFINADKALITKDSATNVILLGGLAYSTTPTLSQIQALQTQDTGVLKVYQEETNWTDTNQGNQPRRASQQTPFPVQVLGGSVTIGSLPAISGTVTARLQDGSGNNLTSTSIGGVQRLNVSLASAATPGGTLPSFVNVYGGSDGSAVRTISVDSSGRQNINAQFPRVTLIDGSGTVTTANTAITVFASSSTRSYLLVQVTTGSAFVNVGATATTVNGINLTAGQGYSWETTIPQGIVSLISTTTSSRYVAKEA